MAENLILPIGFDLEAAVRKAESEGASAIRRLEKVFSRQPLVLRTDASGFDELGKSAELLKARLKEIKDQWDKMPTSVKFDLDPEGRVKQLTAEGKALWDELLRINTALQGVSMGIQQMARESQRQLEAENKAEQKRQQAIAASLRAEYKRIEAKRQAEAASKRELQMLNQQYAAEERRQRLASSDASIARRQQVIKTLRAEENTIANISAKLQHWQQVMNSSAMDGRQFKRAAEEVRRLSQKLSEAQARISQLTTTTSNVSARQSAAVRQVNQEFRNQETYVSRLLKRMAVFASFSYASQFLTNVREVTAQFELQRVSLGAIIQDQSRANQLWAEIKTFALKSPVKILDLTKYTKQVAAYGVETDKLFDTTKRIMDISVGLGVDASRLVLAYGQVKAASYLRAAEIRQFTEAGIPMLELLAEKFTELNGKAVTTEQVMDMVSKRMVGFDMVEQIFKDMTSAGGMFFDMQEKQGNTLYGLWAKLGDAASVMYDEIGNTDYINSGMKDLIQLLTDLMKNWRLAGREIAVVAGAILLLRVNTILSAQGTALATKATNDYAVATTRLNAAQKRGAQTAAYAAGLSKKAAILNRAASISTNAWTAATLRLQAAMYSLKAAFIGNWVTLTIAAVAAIGAALYSAYEKAHKLQNELKEISDAGHAESAKSVFNFERLANAALEAATGSREQKEALDELRRSYGDIIPIEQLSLENLQKMRAQGYEPLTAAIKEYIAQRTLQKEIDAITSHYTEDTIAKQRKLRELFKRSSIYSFFKGVAWSPITGLDNDQISQVFANVDKIAQDKSKSWEDVWIEAIKGVTDVSEDAEKKMRNIFVSETQNAQQQSYNDKMRDIVENTRNMADETDIATKKMETQTGSLGKYKQTLDETSKSLAGLRLLYTDGREVDASSFLGKQMVSNASIKAWKDDIVENLQDAGIAIKNEWFNIIANINSKDASKISTINFAPILDAVDAAKDKLGNSYAQLRNSIVKYQKLYDGIVPSDRTVSAMRSRLMQIANNVDKTGNIMNDLQRHLMKTGDNWENYSKSVRDAVKDYEAQIDEMQKINASIKNGEKGVGPLDPSKYSDEEIKKVQLLVEALKQLFPFLAPEKSSGGRQSDPRLQTLQEIANKMAEVNKEYDELLKKEGQTKALADTQKLFASSFEQMEATAKKYGFKLPAFEVPQTIEDVQKWYRAIMDNVKRLNLKNADKVLIELGFKSDKAAIDKQQKDIEKHLKDLADRISRTKTAKEFYEKILSQTGDVELAARVSLQIYGSTGRELKEQVKEQFAQAFKSLENDHADIMPKVSEIIDRGAYEELRDYIALLPKDQQKAAEDLVKAQQQMSVKQYEQWLKDLEKAKDYADKRIELSRYTANQIAAIEERIAKLNPQAADYEQQKAMLEKLIAGYKSREDKEAAKIEYDMFKDMPLYVQMFDNLDNASSTMLNNMLTLLKKNKAKWGEFLDPTQLKEMQSRMNEIEKQLAARNPFKTLSKSLKDWWALRKSGRNRKDDEDAATKAIEAETAAMERWLAADKAYQAALKAHGNDTENEDVKAAKDKADVAEDEYKKAKETSESAQSQAEAWKKIADNIDNANQKIDEYQDQINKALDEVLSMMDALGVDAIDMEFFNSMKEGFNQILDGSQSAVQAFGQFATGNYFGAAMSSVSAITGIASGISNLFSAGKVKKANKEIKRQQELLDQLEYTYGRLEKAADKVFGRDYLNNYNQQLKNLQAQQTAYLKQAQAERSKGKKADENKIKEYENQARETADAIKELQEDLVAHFTGSSRTDVARQMAKSWVDARVSMSDTFAAIKSDYSDLIKNMIVEGAAARVIENALTPVWDNMEKMLAKNDIDGAIDSLVNGMDAALTQANNGMEVLWKALEARGYDMKQLIGDVDSEYTGIAKNIAGATSEEINTAAAIGNTIMYHTSHLPVISQNVAAMYQLMSQGKTALPDSGSTGWTDWQQQAMDNYNAIARNTADTVVECRRAAVACEAATEKLNRIIVVKGGKFAVNTTYV